MTCQLANVGTKCPGSTIGGNCIIYNEDGVKTFERWGYCPYKKARDVKKEVKKHKLNPQKAAKRKSSGGGEQ